MDPRQAGKVHAFKYCAIVGALRDAVSLTKYSKQGPKSLVIRSYGKLRLAFKREIMKSAKLAPRVSDIDYDQLRAPDADLDEIVAPVARGPTDSELLERALPRWSFKGSG